MSRYIDVDAFERFVMFNTNIEDMQDVIYALRDYPTADVRENVPVRCILKIQFSPVYGAKCRRWG